LVSCPSYRWVRDGLIINVNIALNRVRWVFYENMPLPLLPLALGALFGAATKKERFSGGQGPKEEGWDDREGLYSETGQIIGERVHAAAVDLYKQY